MITKNVDGDIFDGRKQEKWSKNEKLKKEKKKSWICEAGFAELEVTLLIIK